MNAGLVTLLTSTKARAPNDLPKHYYSLINAMGPKPQVRVGSQTSTRVSMEPFGM